jgi:hypothetical protein
MPGWYYGYRDDLAEIKLAQRLSKTRGRKHRKRAISEVTAEEASFVKGLARRGLSVPRVIPLENHTMSC